MPNYRRNYQPGGTFFFTVVTHERRPILTTPLGRECLRLAMGSVRRERPFEILAIVLLPDHLHAVWTLPRGDADYSIRWKQIKERFTRGYLRSSHAHAPLSESRLRHKEQAIWRRRFWEHTCYDEEDLENCINYIHYNPCKHGLFARVREYPWSSFHRFVDKGAYDPDWGGTDLCSGSRFERME